MGDMTNKDDFEVEVEKSESDAQLRLLAVSAMTSTLLHELMQPLSAALNYLGVASRRLQRDDRDTGLDALGRSEASVRKATDIIRGMRAFVLDGAVRSRPLKLAEAVDKVREEMEAERRCAIDVAFVAGRNAETVVVDPLLIGLVLANLLVNAAEAVPQGSQARVRIGSSRLGDAVIVTISDEGPGLSTGVHANLFEALYTTKRAGAGLGLPLCKVIVEAHGGQLWAAGPGAIGATFFMTLPAAPAVAA
jgi:two-component system sensor kinase FixL